MTTKEKEFAIGLPIKYAEVGLLPTYFAEFGYAMNVKTTDGVVVKFIKVKRFTEPCDGLGEVCKRIYNMPFEKIDRVWQRRMKRHYGRSYDIVEMHMINHASAEDGIDI